MTPDEERMLDFETKRANRNQRDLEHAEMRFAITLVALCFVLLADAAVGSGWGGRDCRNPMAGVLLGCIIVTLVYKGIRKHLRETRINRGG